MNNQSSPTAYKSRDIYLSTALKASGIPLLRVEGSSGGKAFFIFKYSQKIEDIIADFHNGRLKLDAKLLFSVWKDMKSLAFSAAENHQKQYQNGGYQNGDSSHPNRF